MEKEKSDAERLRELEALTKNLMQEQKSSQRRIHDLQSELELTKTNTITGVLQAKFGDVEDVSADDLQEVLSLLRKEDEIRRKNDRKDSWLVRPVERVGGIIITKYHW